MTPWLRVAAATGIAFTVSAVASLVLARSSCTFLPRDTPNFRSLHSSPTPRTGGLAILLGISGALLLTQGLPAASSVWIVAATTLLAIVSFMDDRKGLPISARLVAHALAGAAVVWGARIQASAVWLPFFHDVSLGALGAPLSFLGILWLTNLYNFMDGMDGFAAGMTIFGCSFLGMEAWTGGDTSTALTAFTLSAAAAGFLLQNRPRARIFMGDVGAIPIGFLVSVLALRASREGSLELGAACLAFAPFIVDASITLARRVLAGEPVWAAHRSHYYQRFVLAGCDQRLVLTVEYAAMIASGIAAAVYARYASARIALLGAGIVAVSSLHWWLTRVEARASERRVRPETG